MEKEISSANDTNESDLKSGHNCTGCILWYHNGILSHLEFCNSTLPCKSRNQTCALKNNVCVNDYTTYYNGKENAIDWYFNNMSFICVLWNKLINTWWYWNWIFQMQDYLGKPIL